MAMQSALSDYAIRERIGHGSFGSVYRVVRKLDGEYYALKEVDLQGMTSMVSDYGLPGLQRPDLTACSHA